MHATVHISGQIKYILKNKNIYINISRYLKPVSISKFTPNENYNINKHNLTSGRYQPSMGAQRRREEGRYEKESKRAADLEAENVRLKAENRRLAAEVERAEIRTRYHEKRYQELKASSWPKEVQGTQEVKLLKDLQVKELQEQYTSESKRLMAVRASASSDCQTLQPRAKELADMVDSKSSTIKNLVVTNTSELRKKDHEIESKNAEIVSLKNLISSLERDIQN